MALPAALVSLIGARLRRRPPPAQAPPLLGDEELEALRRRARLLRRRPVPGPLPGPRPSLFRGRGLELEGSRPYQPGDEPRHIDWRATARSGRPVTKLFREERESRLLILLDRGPAMHFGTAGRPKSALAARCAALLAFAAADAGEPVAALLAEPGGLRRFPPARRAVEALPLLQAAAAPPPRLPAPAAPGPGALLAEALRGLPPGALLCLVGDLRGLGEEDLPLLRAAAARHRLLALRIGDPAEEELPPAGRLRLADPRSGAGGPWTVDLSDPALRARYRELARERREALARLLARAGAELLELSTADAEPLAPLEARL